MTCSTSTSCARKASAAWHGHIRDPQPDRDGDVVLAGFERFVGLEGQFGPLAHLPPVVEDAGHLGEGVSVAVDGKRGALGWHRLLVEGEVDGFDHRQAQAPVVGHAHLDAPAGAPVV